MARLFAHSSPVDVDVRAVLASCWSSMSSAMCSTAAASPPCICRRASSSRPWTPQGSTPGHTAISQDPDHTRRCVPSHGTATLALFQALYCQAAMRTRKPARQGRAPALLHGRPSPTPPLSYPTMHPHARSCWALATWPPRPSPPAPRPARPSASSSAARSATRSPGAARTSRGRPSTSSASCCSCPWCASRSADAARLPVAAARACAALCRGHATRQSHLTPPGRSWALSAGNGTSAAGSGWARACPSSRIRHDLLIVAQGC
jgi:hypothetical protein